MKHRTKKFGLVALSLSMAALFGASFAMQTPVQNMQNNLGGSNNLVSANSSNLTRLSDEFAAKMDTTQFINSDILKEMEALNSNDDGSRRIIVEFESKSQLDLYLENTSIQKNYADFTGYVNANAGIAYAATLEKEQASFFRALDKTSLQYERRHAYTSILNAVSIVVDSKDVAAISRMDGVKNVILSETYAQPLVEPTVNVVNVYGTGIYDSSDVAYKGDGMLVAVLDTGLDIAHNAFKTMPPTEKLDLAGVEEVFDRLAASSYNSSVGPEDVYYNKKVPFAYDYADKDADVFAVANSHGVHVAGIIAGQDDTVTEKDDEAFKDGTKFVGVAPNAQLMIGKVFSDINTEKGAQTDDILAAVADCVTVGADVINMSLGMSCGFSRESDADRTNEIYDRVYAAGINLVVAAGNEFSSGMSGTYGSTNLTANPDSGTVGSPSSYYSSLSVASISGKKSSYMQLNDGTAVYFNESSSASGKQGKFVEELLNGAKTKELNFVVVPGYGRPTNYNASIKAELAKGNCVAVVSRGDTSFEEKQKVAFDNGAVACIIYNNMSGKISASLGTGKKIPTCTVSASIGQKFKQLGKGTIFLNEEFKAGPFMSDFSSWGPTNDLRIKPEITAHGGEIISAVVGGYASNSGTSMASPNMAGAVTLLRQHVSENYGLTGIALANRVNQLLMSTATIVYDENGLPYAVRKQGAGLGDIGKAMNTESFLYVENSSKSKLELGDDKEKTGVYTMHFRASNISNVTKTYNLDAFAMTESVSIDGITVEEKAYMLNNIQKSFLVNGKPCNGTVVLEAGADVEISVVLSLSAEEKEYLDASFENGMYIEGFVTMEDAGDGVDLSIPYLAFYGDWTQAPMFDKSLYEVSHDKYDASLKEEDKTVAAIFESIALGKAYKEYSEFYLPLGQYLYNMANDADPGIEASVDKIAIGNGEYGVYSFYAMYLGMLRGASEMGIRVENAATGRVLLDTTEYNVRKSHGAGPSVVEMEMSSEELGLMNNEKYIITLTANYGYGSTTVDVKEFGFYVDYQSPLIQKSVIRYEDNGNGTREAYLDLEIYDNHYPQSVQLFIPISDTEADFVNAYPIPVKDPVRDGISKLSIKVTDYLDLLPKSGTYENLLGIRIDDYALNASAYLVSANKTIVDEIDVKYTYKDANRVEVEASLAGETILLQPNEYIDLNKDMVTVIKAEGNIQGKLSTTMVGYAAYYCTNKDAHGLECGFAFDERNGYTYVKGDWYYQDGQILQKEADDTTATYPAFTRFFNVIATPVVKNGTRYDQPESKHFVCPKCGVEETFSFNTRSGKITPKSFVAAVQDPMVFDVEFISGDPSIVEAKNGTIHAVGVGTTTITARPISAEAGKNDFIFTVKVEGDTMNTFVEQITVGHFYNHTKEVTRYTSQGGATVDCGSELTLYPSFSPWYVTSIPDLTWQVSNPEYAEIVTSSAESAKIICKKPGAVSVLISSASNALIGTFTLVIEEEYRMSSYYLQEYKGIGYSETYVENGVERKMLVIPANLGIVIMGSWSTNNYYEGTFEDVEGLDTVVIPQGVTSIGSKCFYNTSIRRIYLPSSIEHISTSAFAGTPLEEVYWYDAGENSDSGIEYDADDNTYDWNIFYANTSDVCTAKRVVIHYNAFYNCKKLSVFDCSRVTAMYSGAFEYCTKLTYADLTNVRFAQGSLFYGCSALKTVALDEATQLGASSFASTAITEIDFYGTKVNNSTFSGMKNLKKITFHNDVESIGNSAFSGCTALTSIVFNGECKQFGTNVFNGCTALTKVELPAGVEKLGDNMFNSCTALTEVVINANSPLTSIGANLFKGCSNFKKVSLSGASEQYTTVESGAYSMLTNANGTKILITPPSYPVATGSVFTVPTQYNGAAIEEIAPYSYAANTSLNNKQVVIPEGITVIGANAFRETNITQVVIPSTVTTIEKGTFENCAKLETVIFLCDIKEIPDNAFNGCKKLTNVQIPASVEYIGDYAFKGTDIRTLMISENVREIGMESFRDCVSLAELRFADQAALEVIGQAAFGGCASLKAVALPDTVRVMKNNAFVGCTSLTSVYVSAGLEVMEDYAFSACPALTTFEMGDGAKMIGGYAFYTPANNNGFYYHNALKNVTIPDSVETIGAFAFAGNTVLRRVVLNGVHTIGDYAFHYATALERVDGTDSLETIGVHAFTGSGIKDISLTNVKYIQAQAFYGTELNLNKTSGNLMLPNAIEIGGGAFYNCKTITQVTLPNVKVLGEMAFAADSESAIYSVNVGDKLETMGATVFYNSKISYISLPKTVKEIAAPAFTGCLSLSRIIVAADNKNFFVDSAFGGLYKYLENGTYELVSVPNNIHMEKIAEDGDYTKLEPFKILEGTSRIGAWAMGHCVYIHAVEIPASVKNIGPYAFYNVGMAILNGNAQLAQTSRVPFTKFIFKGLEAPILESAYTDNSAALDEMYATFVYTCGYLLSDMIIPVNAKGFESILYRYFFMEQHYSEELIEPDTQTLLDWLTTLDVEALTAADKKTVEQMDMIYFMMKASQKAFINEEYTAKLTAAVEKMAAIEA